MSKSNIFFSSDFHAMHKNICEGSTDWVNKSGCRKFKDQYHMTNVLIDNINNTVPYDGTLYFLGDWSFGGKDNIYELWKRINCKQIHLILGNHDQHIRKNVKIELMGNDMRGYLKDNWGIQDVFLSVQDYMEVSIEGQPVVMCHFPISSWNNMSKGSYHLYGHVHGTYQNHGKSMDVGVDTHPEFRPYSWEEIKTAMKNKTIDKIDHH